MRLGFLLSILTTGFIIDVEVITHIRTATMVATDIVGTNLRAPAVISQTFINI